MKKIDLRDAFFNTLYGVMRENKDVVILTADHGAFGLKRIEKDLPSQYYNVGICEQNMISVAAGLAKCGKKVYVYAINNFVSLRTIEQINIDVCSMNLDVNIVAVGAGFTYSTDGPTHHGTQDVSLVLNIPNLTVYNVTDATSTQKITQLSYELAGPKYIRIEKGFVPSYYTESDNIHLGYKEMKAGNSVGIISSGYMTHVAAMISIDLEKEGISVAHLDLTRISPLPATKIKQFCNQKKIIVLEENIESGGLGEKIAALVYKSTHLSTFVSVAIEDGFVFDYGSRQDLHVKNKLDAASIKNKVRNLMTVPKTNCESINHQKVADILTIPVDSLTSHTQKLIQNFDLKYKHLTTEELQLAILSVLEKSQKRKKVKSGRSRQPDWERGWQENLDEYVSTEKENSLKPKYYRPEKFSRLDGTFVQPLTSDFVFKFSRILQSQVYETKLEAMDNIYEFGCGSGHNLHFLSKLYENKKIVGLDWSSAAVNLVNLLNKKISNNITGQLFDFFSPDKNDVVVPPKSAFITMGGLEQIGEKHNKFLDFVLKKKPEVVINIEPIQEFYDRSNLADFIAFNYHEERNYLKGYYTKLLSMEKQGLIKIEDAKKVNFGGLFHDGWSILVWRPLSTTSAKTD